MATLYIRNLDDDAAARIKRAAQVRGLTLAEYIERLEELHKFVRAGAILSATAQIRTAGLALPSED